MNKTIFEEKWKVIRGLTIAWWSLVAEYDLNKVDKAEDKYDRYITMLRVKYGYTRQEAREELKKRLVEHEVKNKG